MERRGIVMVLSKEELIRVRAELLKIRMSVRKKGEKLKAKKFSSIINQCMEYLGVTNLMLRKKFDLNSHILLRWKNGAHSPRIYLQLDILTYFIKRTLLLKSRCTEEINIDKEYLCKTCSKPISKEQVAKAKRQQRYPSYCSKSCWQQRPREHNYDTDFLNERTDFAGYFIGLFITDGHKSKQDGTISIELIDKQVIYDIVKYTHYENVVSYTDRKEKIFIVNGKEHRSLVKPTHIIRYSGPIRRAMDAMGFPDGKKTGSEFIPDWVTDAIFYACLRGIIDGDGSFDLEGNHGYLLCSICGASRHLMEQIHERLKRLGIVVGGAIEETHPDFYKLHFGHADSVSIGNFVYKNISVTLQRKYENYIIGKKHKLLLESQKDKICATPGCGFPARTKGLCKVCYNHEYNTNIMTERQKKKHRKTSDKWRKENIGHVNEVRRKNYAKNPEKGRESTKQWRQQNPEKVNEYKRVHNQEHPEIRSEQHKRLRQLNHEKIREQEKASYERNKDKKLASARAYKKDHRAEIAAKNALYREGAKESEKAYDKQRYEANKEEIKRKRMERYYQKKEAQATA